MLVQCNGNGEIDARVFTGKDYGAQDDKMRNSHHHWVRHYGTGGPDKRCSIVETRANDKS